MEELSSSWFWKAFFSIFQNSEASWCSVLIGCSWASLRKYQSVTIPMTLDTASLFFSRVRRSRNSLGTRLYANLTKQARSKRLTLQYVTMFADICQLPKDPSQLQFFPPSKDSESCFGFSDPCRGDQSQIAAQASKVCDSKHPS